MRYSSSNVSKYNLLLSPLVMAKIISGQRKHFGHFCDLLLLALHASYLVSSPLKAGNLLALQLVTHQGSTWTYFARYKSVHFEVSPQLYRKTSCCEIVTSQLSKTAHP